MKANQLKLSAIGTGIVLAAFILTGTAGCHSGMNEPGNNGVETPTNVPGEQVTPVTNTKSDTIRADTNRRRTDTVR